MTENTETNQTDSDSESNRERREQDCKDLIQESLRQANQYHTFMDKAKEWGRDMSGQLWVNAGIEDGIRNEETELSRELQQAAKIVETVTERVEQGDNNRARKADEIRQ